MKFLMVTIIAGILATAGMTFVLWFITRMSWANADMVRALGSFMTRSYNNALGVGMLIHFTAGIPIAMLYTIFFSILNITDLAGMIIAGVFVSFFHGFAFSFIMLTVAEYHPVERFKSADFQVAVAHLLGHIVYGVLVGAVVGISGYRLVLP